MRSIEPEPCPFCALSHVASVECNEADIVDEDWDDEFGDTFWPDDEEEEPEVENLL